MAGRRWYRLACVWLAPGYAHGMQLIAGLVALLSVTLSPPFVAAEVRATSVGPEGMRLEVDVEVVGDPVAVVVRGAGPHDELPPVALDDRGDGHWVGIVDLPVVEDIVMGFEYLPGSGVGSLSELHRLTELGVDPAVFQIGEEPEDATAVAAEPEEEPSTGWAWLALAAGAAGVALVLVWWVWPARRDSSGGSDEVDNLDGGDPDGDDPDTGGDATDSGPDAVAVGDVTEEG